MKNVQDIYPLSPMQQGLLFHTLEASLEGIYCEQSRFTFHGLDVARFQDAWRVVIERHPILRTAFMWEGLDEPLQIVRQQVALPWEEQDWRATPVAQQPERLEAFLLADRARGFTLGKAPLMRLTLLQLSSDTFHLIWSHHHMLLDGWSIALLLDEVFTAYQAFRQGLPHSLPPAQPFSNYIAWLRKQDMGAARTFWQQRLSGFTAPTPLMVDQLMQAVSQQGEAGCLEYDLRLSRAATGAIQEFARRQQLTLNTVVQGAWALLLSRYSGENDVVFGTTVSTRPVELPGIETMVGIFINTLPCRVQLAPEMELASWLRQIQREQVEARQYDYTPLVQIQQWSEVTRGQPLFKSVLVVESYPQHTRGEAEQTELTAEESWYATSQTNYPLAVLIGPGEELLLRAYYQQHFEEETIARLLGHLRVILETMVSVPGLRLREITLLTVRERQQLLSEWNTQLGEYPDKGVQKLFEEQVERRPDAIALVYADQHLSYAGLNICANRLAHALRRQGVGPEVVTGICMERSLELVVATLGVLKAGGGYLPLDPRLPLDRLQFILQDIQPPVIVTQDPLAHLFPSARMHVLSLQRDWSQIAEESCANPCLVNAQTNLAYVISTSGSSGAPKGVQVSHSGLSNLAVAQIAAFQLTPSSRVLQFASWAFDAAVSELVTTLLSGAVLCLASAESIRPGDDLAQTLNEQAITTVTLPPSALDTLPSPDQEAYPYLQTLISAGEPCSGETVGRWLDHCRVINAYGPTEATVCATWQLCEAGWERPPIGKPLTNAEIYVLDPRLQPLPVGVPGELYIGGSGLARGYCKRSDLTAAAFVPHPFGVVPGARLYRTGDLVSYLPDWSLLFWGRCDSQIKLRGYRIEPGEIEETLTQHPAIKAAVVMLREDPPHEKRLVAYVVTEQGEALAAELRSYLQKWLPEYMIPSAFVTLRAFPLT